MKRTNTVTLRSLSFLPKKGCKREENKRLYLEVVWFNIDPDRFRAYLTSGFMIYYLRPFHSAPWSKNPALILVAYRPSRSREST